MSLPQVRVGNWIKTDEDSWCSLDHIIEVCIKYQGRETRQDDDYEVCIIVAITDFWLPNSEEKKQARDHQNFFNQMSDQQERDIFRGSRADCEQIVQQILTPKV